MSTRKLFILVLIGTTIASCAPMRSKTQKNITIPVGITLSLIQKKIDAASKGATITFLSGSHYVDGTLKLKSDIHLCGEKGAVIFQKRKNKETFSGIGVSNVNISNLKFVGFGFYSSSWKSVGMHKDRAINLYNSSAIIVENCIFLNHGLSSIFLNGCKKVKIQDNFIEGTHNFGTKLKRKDNFQFGINITGLKGFYASEDILIIDNEICFVNQGLITSSGNGKQAKSIVVKSNYIHDVIGQHGIYASTSNTDIIYNKIEKTGLEGIKVQASHANIENVKLQGNIIRDCIHSQGINITEISKGKYYINSLLLDQNSITNCGRGLNLSGRLKNISVNQLKINGTTKQYGIIFRLRDKSNVHIDNIEITNPKTEALYAKCDKGSVLSVGDVDVYYAGQKIKKKPIKIVKGSKVDFSRVRIQESE